MRHPLVMLAFMGTLLTPAAENHAAPLNVTPPQTTASENDEPQAPLRDNMGLSIVPHRAIYNLSLASAKNGSNVKGVSGKMMFDWNDTCDGWTVQQHMQLHFNLGENGESTVVSSEITWESKEGDKYNFNIRRITDGKETEKFRGKATLGPDGGTVAYSVPEGKTDKLPAGSLFPSAHTRMLLQKAASGEKFFMRQVFDGSDEEGTNGVSAYISPPIAEHQKTELPTSLKNNRLLQATEWPIRLAYFKETGETGESGESDFEMNLNLLSNGVAKSIRIDYNDFSVQGTLAALEPLPKHDCATAP
ncbi:MAG: cell envelope integrity EipB family protein [Bdellovibrionales bacterium]